MTPGQVKLAMTSVEAHEAAVDALRRFRLFAGGSLDPVKVQVRVGDGKLARDVVRFADFAPAPRPAPVAPRGAA